MAGAGTDIEALYRSERARLEGRLRRLLGHNNAASDIVHDLFVRLWERRGEARDDAVAYLMRSARNAAIDHIRSERIRSDYRVLTVIEQHARPSPTPHDIVVAREALGIVDRAIDALSDRTRHVFLLNRVHGCSYAEIAKALGISTSAVEKHMTRALREIREAVIES